MRMSSIPRLRVKVILVIRRNETARKAIDVKVNNVAIRAWFSSTMGTSQIYHMIASLKSTSSPATFSLNLKPMVYTSDSKPPSKEQKLGI